MDRFPAYPFLYPLHPFKEFCVVALLYLEFALGELHLAHGDEPVVPVEDQVHLRPVSRAIGLDEP